jgi:outer membrane protein OmpA-like peptidoglycan-associated protein
MVLFNSFFNDYDMKQLFLTLAFLGGFTAAVAQETAIDVVEVPASRYSVSTNSFWSNWFVSVGGGAQVIYGTPRGDASFGDRMTPALALSVGKQFTPGLALRVGANGIWSKQVSHHETSDFQYFNLHADALFDLLNMIGGYYPGRVYHLIPYVGAGAYHVFDLDHGWGMGFNGGFINRFQLGQAFSIDLELSIAMLNKTFDNVTTQRRGFDKLLGATVSLTYNLPTRGFRNTPDVDALVALTAAQSAACAQQLADCEAQNEALVGQLQQALNATPPPPSPGKSSGRPVAYMPAQSIFFNLNSAEIASRKDLVNLSSIAKMAMENHWTLVLNGYADSNTGSPEYNRRLSLERAETVAAELQKMGVPLSHMVVKGDGGVDKLSPYSYNRRVVITLQQ